MLHVIYGRDSFSRLEALQELKRQLDEDGMLETNTTVLNASQTSPQEVIAACGTVPFLGSRRLVIVEGLLQQAGGGAKGRRPKKRESPPEDVGSWQALVEYIDEMPETTALVLIDGDVSDGELLSALRDKVTPVEFPALNDGGLRRWVNMRAQALGLRIDPGGLRLLVQLAGGQKDERGAEYVDTWALASELEKLSAYAAGAPVRAEDVRILVNKAREEKAWALADAVADRKAVQAMRLLHELLAQGAAGQVLLSTIEGRYRRLAIAREMLDAGASERSIGERVGSRRYALERMIEQAQRYSSSGLRAAFARLVQADMDIKLGLYAEELSIELLINDLAVVSASRAA